MRPPAPDSGSRHPDTGWLLRLRWGALVGQGLLVVAVERGMGLSLPILPLLGLVAVGLAIQLALLLRLRGGRSLTARGLLAVLALDSLLLTGLLGLSGGPFNPFSIFLLVNLTLGAMLLPARACWGLVAFSLTLFGALFFVPEGTIAGLQLPDHATLMTVHLRGMWLAFAAAAFFIVHFVQRITRALDTHALALAEARREQARAERIRGLATLAAGTAHELSTPLSTIAVASAELERLLQRPGLGEAQQSEALADASLIREQVRRCREVLQQLSVEAGHPLGEGLAPLSLGELLADALVGLPEASRVQLPEDPRGRALTVEAPRRALARSVRSLLTNAVQASGDAAPVRVSLEAREDVARLVVRDAGVGMSPELLARACEPFFSTREPGEGMGLGLYLARSLADQLGGSLALTSRAGEGTEVVLTLPLARLPAASGDPAGGA